MVTEKKISVASWRPPKKVNFGPWVGELAGMSQTETASFNAASPKFTSKKTHFLVTENIHNHTTEGIRNSERVGVKDPGNSRGEGVGQSV